MADTLIHNVRLLQPGVGAVGDSVLIHDGVIHEIATGLNPAEPDTALVDGGGRLLTPGMIDIHTHGLHTCLYETSPQDLIECATFPPRHGTTTVLPTLYSVMNRQSLSRLEKLSAALDSCEGASCPGFHLEGPFLKLAGAGAHTTPGDVELLKVILAATSGRVLAMSISPDTENILPVIEYLQSEGIVPFITHTHADIDQTLTAIEAGARHATHFYDVFPIPAETDPGVRPVGAVEAMLADPRCTVDFIADGVHVHPIAIKAALAAKGWEGVILITDSNIGAGLPSGIYETPWGYPVRTTQSGAARMHIPDTPHDGMLAGSSLTMDRGMSNMLRWLDLPDHQVWAMGTRNPARLLGMNRKGALEVGADADLVIWDLDTDNNLNAWQTWIGGRCVFDKKRS